MTLDQAMDDGRAAAIIGAAPDTNPFPEDGARRTAWIVGYNNASDWTIGDERRTNTSPLFQQLCDEVEGLIRNSGPALVNGQANNVAAIILTRLVHRWGLRPDNWKPGDPPPKKARPR